MAGRLQPLSPPAPWHTGGSNPATRRIPTRHAPGDSQAGGCPGPQDAIQSGLGWAPTTGASPSLGRPRSAIPALRGETRLAHAQSISRTGAARTPVSGILG